MSQICEYQHKKFSLKTEEYTHKKFGLHMKKRKLEEVQDKENSPNMTVETILQKVNDPEQQPPVAKRRQTKTLFRPWLDKDKKESVTPKPTQKTTISPQVLATIPSNIMSYRANMIRQYPAKQRTEKEQQRRNRNTLACLLNRRQKQAEQLQLQQQYAAYQQHQHALMEQSIRSGLYLRHLQQLALQRQHQLFVFGH